MRKRRRLRCGTREDEDRDDKNNKTGKEDNDDVWMIIDNKNEVYR